MKCSDCGHENRAGVLLCDNCGSDIYDILVGEAATKQLNRDATRDLRLTEPPSSRPLMLYVSDGSTPLSIERLNSLVMGRVDPETNNNVDIDLTPFDALNSGVSRKHATLDARQDPPTITDLGSYNGTFVNGERLEAETPQDLHSGDEIQLGRLKMRLYFK